MSSLNVIIFSFSILLWKVFCLLITEEFFSPKVPREQLPIIGALIRRLSHEVDLDEVARIDYFDIYNKYHNSIGVYWAWHNGKCYGLTDPIWQPSGGIALAQMIASEEQRLRAFGVLKHGGVAIDIGAHVGDSTLPMARLANRTIAFDPSKMAYPLLRLNAAINPGLHIDVHNLAIAERNEAIEMEYGGNNCNGGVGGPQYGRNNTTSWIKTHAVHLGAFLEETYGKGIIAQIRYIKIDCEGYDHAILSSLTDMLREMDTKPIIQIENYFPSNGFLSDDAMKVIMAIQSLPVAYTIFCTKQCNSPRMCDTAADDLVTVMAVDGGKVQLLRGRRRGSASCSDFMLIPEVGARESGHHAHGGAHRTRAHSHVRRPLD